MIRFSHLGYTSAKTENAHAVKPGTESRWEGAEAFCGILIGRMRARTAKSDVGCRDCRRELGLGEPERRRPSVRSW